MNLCKCNCGQYCKNHYVHGHNNKGKTHSEETIQKISLTKLGHDVSKTARDKIRFTLLIKNHTAIETLEIIQNIQIPKLCKCNCGKFVKTGNQFINGHNGKL